MDRYRLVPAGSDEYRALVATRRWITIHVSNGTALMRRQGTPK